MSNFWLYNLLYTFLEVVVVVVVIASNDEGRMDAYGAVQNELMVTSQHC